MANDDLNRAAIWAWRSWNHGSTENQDAAFHFLRQALLDNGVTADELDNQESEELPDDN